MGEDSVHTNSQSENNFSFKEAVITRRIKKGLLLSINENRDMREGVIFNADIKNELQPLLDNRSIIGTTINVRFVYQPTVGKDTPVYTQRKYYSEGEELELEISGEDDKYIFAQTDEGFEYKLAKATWETGPKYNKQIIGKKIKCRVYKVLWGKSYFDRNEIPNPYFFSINEWVNESQIITITFNEWIKFPDNEDKLKLKDDYLNRNANYIFSYLSLLEDLIFDTIGQHNVKSAISLLKTVIQIDQKILNCGFLLTQKQSLRDETKKTIESKISKYNFHLEHLNKIDKLGIDRIFEDVIELAKGNNNITDEVIKNIYLIDFIMDHFPIDEIKNHQLESLGAILLNNKMIFSNEGAFSSFRWLLTKRRKFVRKNLFSSLRFQSSEFFEHNQSLAHFIFLKYLEYQFCRNFKDLIQAFLEKASLLYYKALYVKDRKIKKKLINDSIELLKDLNITKRDFMDTDQYSIWTRNMNNIMARNYEELYSLDVSEEDSIQYLVMARDHYIFAKAKRGYLLEYYIQYLSVINLIKVTEDQEIDGLIFNINLVHQRIIEDLKYSKIFPLIEYFDKFYQIITRVGDTNQLTVEHLFALINDNCEESKGFPCISKLARIILSNNLLVDLLNDKYTFWKKIQEFLDEGEFSLPMEGVITDEDDEQDDLHPVFIEENHKIEFKGSIALHLDKYFYTRKVELNDAVKKSFLKTLVGMLNANGGEIYVGVLELEKYSNLSKLIYLGDFNPIFYKSKIIIGFDKEIESYNNSVDEHMRHISTTLRNRIDSDVMQNVLIEPQLIRGKNVYKILVQKGSRDDGYYLDKTEFYVRENNETLLYDNQKTVAFLLRKIKNREP